MDAMTTPLPHHGRYEALNLVEQPVWIFDFDRRCIYWANRSAVRLWSAETLDELCRRDLGRDMSDSVARRLAQYQADFVAHGSVFNEQWTLYPGGRPVSLNVRLSPHVLDDGRMGMLNEARETAPTEPESLRSVEALMHTAVMITLYGQGGRPLYRNPASRSSARGHDQTLGERIADPAAVARLLATLDESGSATQTLTVNTADGERWHEISARRCRDAVTGQEAVLFSEVDISAIKRTEAQAQFLALHDPLTGLPNRHHVMQRFSEAMQQIRAGGQEAALIFIDLDHFKDVNDTLGHAAGDALLVEVAQRLRRAVRGGDLVARLGGDEFLILLTANDIQHEVDLVRERLMRTVAEPVQVNNQPVRVTPSMGVSLYPRDGEDIDTLLRHADLAMYSAKERGRNELAYYDAGMSVALKSRTALEAELRSAFDLCEFEVHYQPIIDVASHRIVGAEALARWRHPARGLVPPDVFIPVCENTGLIHALGALVFGMAVRQQAAWAAAGHDLQVSVNLSARQMRQPELLPELKRALREAGADPSRVQLEITESMLLGHDAALVGLLHGIDAMGMGIALDDFGTGYSNLAYLQRFPIRTLKIDKVFIQGLDDNRPLAELIVAMSRLMRLTLVAEGVETPEQLHWVRSQGIERCQGYLFAPALSVAEFGRRLAASPGPALTRAAAPRSGPAAPPAAPESSRTPHR